MKDGARSSAAQHGSRGGSLAGKLGRSRYEVHARSTKSVLPFRHSDHGHVCHVLVESNSSHDLVLVVLQICYARCSRCRCHDKKCMMKIAMDELTIGRHPPTSS